MTMSAPFNLLYPENMECAGDAARLFSKKLMDDAAASVKRIASRDNSDVPTPLAVLEEAWADTRALDGRSTACLLVLQEDQQGPVLHAANLGDSFFCVLRTRGEGDRARLGFAHRC